MTYQLKEQMEFWGVRMKDFPYTIISPEKHSYYNIQKDWIEVHSGAKGTCVRCTGITSTVNSIDGAVVVGPVVAKQQIVSAEHPLFADNNTAVSKHDLSANAVKHDDGKPDWSLVPFESLEGMVKVLEFGAKKYDGWNWTTNGGFSYMRVMRSCLRHLFAWSRGEDLDPESGLSHIHHAMCNLLFISHYIGNKDKYTKDDRQKR